MTIEKLKGGVRKRSQRRQLGLFIDGTGLDRATRRLKRKVDLPKLVKGVSGGLDAVVARYYTLIPYEDDSRQHAFLDAVRRAGMRVVVKRLPPKGISRQVSVDVEMAADIIAFARGFTAFSGLSEYEASDGGSGARNPSTSGAGKQTISLGKLLAQAPEGLSNGASEEDGKLEPAIEDPNTYDPSIQRVVTVVSPSRDLSYALALANQLGADTVNADFGQSQGGDILKSALKWIDLSDSETIWRDA